MRSSADQPVRRHVRSPAADDHVLSLVVIGDASADQLAHLIGPHAHPQLAHPDCSVLVVHPSRRWRGDP